MLSDGKNTSNLVAKRAGTSKSSISRWWQEWKTIDIAEDISVRGGSRAKAVFNLVELGIDVPKGTKEEEADVSE